MSSASISSPIFLPYSLFGSPDSSALSAEPWMIGVSSPGKSYARQQLAHLQLDQVQQLGIVDHVAPCS